MTIKKTGMILPLLLMGWPIFAVAGENIDSVFNMAPEMMLEGMDAREAAAIANHWRWTRKDITSFVTAEEVAFKFPSGISRQIRLPENEFLVAVAPYVYKTHG